MGVRNEDAVRDRSNLCQECPILKMSKRKEPSNEKRASKTHAANTCSEPSVSLTRMKWFGFKRIPTARDRSHTIHVTLLRTANLLVQETCSPRFESGSRKRALPYSTQVIHFLSCLCKTSISLRRVTRSGSAATHHWRTTHRGIRTTKQPEGYSSHKKSSVARPSSCLPRSNRLIAIISSRVE